MSELRFHVEDGIGRIWVDRPQVLNALSREIIDDLDVLLNEIKDNKDVKVLIVGGEENFAAGADIKGMVECNPEEAKAFAFSTTYDKLMNLPIPTIAAIDGYALGGGLEMTLACDMRIATENAKMGLPELGIGIMPGAGGTIRLPRLVGYAKAFEMIALGRQVTAAEAEAIGLVNKVVKKEELLEETRKWAYKLMQKAPIALRVLKKTMQNGALILSPEEAIAYEAEQWASLFSTEDQKEGMRAFVAKRRPQYQDR